MSAQRPGTALHNSTLSGHRSFVFYRSASGAYDYLTQLPVGEHELMFGGGWAMACDDSARGLPEIGIADDSVVNHVGQSYLAGALPQYFGHRNWGMDAQPDSDAASKGENVDGNEQPSPSWGSGRTKAQWSGILGISADTLPWVGRLPEKVCGRAPPQTTVDHGEKEKKVRPRTAPAGEWIAAGYTGEGMVHAWMSGKALAYMVLDRDEDTAEWFPDALRVTEKRWKAANMEKLFERFLR